MSFQRNAENGGRDDEDIEVLSSEEEEEDEEEERRPLNPKHREKAKRRRQSYYKGQYRYFLFGLALLQTLCASGLVLGWAALAVLLHERAIYRTNCTPHAAPPPPPPDFDTVVSTTTATTSAAPSAALSNEDTAVWCQEQQARMALVYALGLIGMYASRAAFAWFMDTFGAKRTTVVGSIVLGLGAFLFIIALDQGAHVFLSHSLTLSLSRTHTHTLSLSLLLPTRLPARSTVLTPLPPSPTEQRWISIPTPLH
jgi:hypothetical protein